MNDDRAPRHPRCPRWGILATIALLSTACAERQQIQLEWPFPPDKPRLRYVETIVGASTFDTGFWASMRRAIFGKDVSGDLVNPAGLALSADETRLYVTCPGVARVLEFDLARRTVRQVASASGHRPSYPHGVATDAQGRLYVGDQREGVVWVYSAKDEFLLQIGKGRLVRPTGVAVDPRRQLLYVVDPGTRERPRHVVEVFALDGRLLRTIGSHGTEPGQFLYAGFATVAKDGRLFVADTLNSRVQVFSPDGDLMTTFGGLGDAPGQFGKPKSVALDVQGNVHVADGQTGWVWIFSPDFRVLMPYGGRANEAPFLLLPNAIAINSKNEIFVADYSGSRVNRYLLFDTSAAEPANAPAKRSPANASGSTR